MSSVGSEENLDNIIATSDPVLDWYSRVNSRRIDVIGDYCGHEVFLVEGDALLLHCFSDQHIDFDPGFQLLHAAWAVENFLKGLVARRCNFHVAFVDEHRELCIPPFASDDVRERYLLARAAIIKHLRTNLPSVHPEIEVNVFTSVTSDAFAEYLLATDLYFVLIHDGAQQTVLQKQTLTPKKSKAIKDEEEEEEERTKIAFRQLMYWFLKQGISSALINGLEWQDTKVVTTVLENPRMSESEIGMTFNDFSDAISEPRPKYLDRSIIESIKSEAEELTEREYVTILILYALLAGSKATKDFADAFLRHTALVSQLHLSERLAKPATFDDAVTASLELFCDEATAILSSETWKDNMDALKCSCDVADLVDGRLLAACLKDKSLGRNESYQSLLKAMKTLGSGSVADENVAANGSRASTTNDTPRPSPDPYAVLPFSNDVFDAHLSPVHLKIDRAADVVDATTSQIFREVAHFHATKRPVPVDPLIREEQLAKAAKQQFFARRRNQWFMAEMSTYAASLTNAVGKVLEPEIITPGATKIEKKEENTKPKAAPKGGKKGAPSKKEAMLAKIASDRSKKEEAGAESIIQGWRLTCAALEKEPTPVARFQKAKQYLTTLTTDLKRNTLEAEVRLYLLNSLVGVWVSACRASEKQKNLHVAALIFDNLSTFSTLRKPITKTIATCLEKTYKELALPKLPIPAPQGDRPLVFKFALAEAPGSSLTIPIPSNDFQLLHCGPYFDRSIDSAPDPRVPFEPDAWQRRVLDGIDAKRSQLVIAPTSAGKTFISFYAMKQVLESNDDDILVYVAPTKALVNQIAAEVQGRFSKTYKYAGNSVWGIHTRDSRINNPTGCQILVTVPHILQIMLLAPSNANTWARRVKWIIFDEVHCIGQAEDGLIWEQLLLMAPCPIIALSATIGNADEFNAWLSSTQKAVGNDFDMVQHKHRYSDLRKFVYTPENSQTGSTEFQGLPENRAFAQLGLDNCDAFSFLHPAASLVNRSRGIPSDLSLEARDCFTLWQCMSKHQTKDYPVGKELDPTVALPAVVKKLHIINWEKGLKALLKEWMEDEGSPFPAVLKDLSSSLTGKSVDQHLSSDKSASKDEVDEAESEEIRESDANSILPLLSKLHEQDALPGIIFNYDRGLCERICKTLLTQLETAETAWKESSPKWKADLAKWEDYKKMMLKANKRNPPKLSKKKGAEGEEGLTKDDLMRDAAGNEASPWASFDPTTPVDRFHFADNRKMTQEELAKHEKELIRREVPEYLLAGLRRGIGVHHAGLNRKYRQVCEILFRRGFLRVVIATGTLALGINMPCKTVIFSGDSVFLTALNYRQAAGRAGRRGFDMLGNVVFHGVAMSKIHRLISSRLPDINGHFPITTTLVLRLFMLLDESKRAAFAVRSVNALLSQPRLYLGGAESKMTVLHHLRFSVEYLRRQYLLDSDGHPLNLAGAVSHLYYTEASSFAFHALLKDGYFHRLCAKIDTNRDAVLEELILTMSHLFGRQYCRQADQEFLEQKRKRSSSVVFLPPVPDNAAAVLRKHNQSTLDIYRAYVRTFVDEHLPEPDETLPLTQSNTGAKKASSSPSGLQRRAPTVVRSPFVALSGHGDDFDSIHDLCATTRSGVFLEEAVIPYVGMYPEESELPLNAYIYDYFHNADVRALATANGIRRGDVWFVLNDFSMVLATVVTSLSNFMNLNTASDLDFTDVRGEGEEAEDAQEDKLIPDADSGYETSSTISGPARPGVQAGTDLPIQVKKKKKVADSWDDDADAEDEELEIAAQKEKRDAEVRKLQEKPEWEDGTGLLNVFKAFKALKEEFDTKFRTMWA